MRDSFYDSGRIAFLTQSMRQFNNQSIDLIENAVSDGLKLWSKMPSFPGTKPSGCCKEQVHGETDACPPKDICLPRCILTIKRTAVIGETIIVPFKIRNNGSIEKTYKLGARPFVDNNGNILAAPTLDSLSATVQPGHAVRRELKCEIVNKFLPGELYETDIVIQEKSHNQNICIKLTTLENRDLPEATPYEEADLDMHFHRWFHHFYCQKPRPSAGGEIIQKESGK